jgi:hypothetical protein
MKFLIRKYYSGYCTHEIEAKNEDIAYELARKLPIKQSEILETLEEWDDCDEIEIVQSN